MLSEVDIFVTLVRTGSLAKAGKLLGMPPSTLSRRLQAFEKRLGTTLFFRSTKALRCTCEGESLYALCKDSVDQLNIALASMKKERVELIGKVRIQLPSSFVDCSESHSILDLLDTYPGIRLELLINDQEPDLILEGIDLLIHVGELKNTACVTKKLFDTELGLFAAPSYLDRTVRPDTADRLVEHEVLHDSSQKDCLMHNQNGPPVQVRHHERLLTRSSMMLLQATLGGMGVGLLPMRLAQRHLESGALIRVLPELSMAGRPVYVSYLSSRSLSACARAVLDKTLALALPLQREATQSAPSSNH